MGVLAKTIMRHLEMVREVEEHRRGMKMSRGLASFVEGRAELAEADLDDVETSEGTRIAGQFETEAADMRSNASYRDSTASISRSNTNADRREEYSSALLKTEHALLEFSQNKVLAGSVRTDLEVVSEPSSFGVTSINLSSPRGTAELSSSPPAEDLSEASSMRQLLSRAANLIRQAFEVDGGAVFLDAQTGFTSEMGRQASGGVQGGASHDDVYNDSPGDSLASDTDHHSSPDPVSDEGESNTYQSKISTTVSSPGLEQASFLRTTSAKERTADILAFSTADASSYHGDPMPSTACFTPFAEKALHTLLKRYPRGKLWTFDFDGAVSSSSEDDILRPSPATDQIQRNKDLRRRKLRSAKTKSDARFLSRHFPGVRQLLFVPLWDAGRARWLSGGFAWSTEPTRVLSKQSELAFLTAFGNSVMAEWSRIDTEIADQKKGDFIGSISHELRSPLHGILASAEFLDEITEGRSKQLVETIDSCGRTLLDTINHILDYSKINHFEKNWRMSKRGGSHPPTASKNVGPLALRQSELPMLNLFQHLDVSVLCEEVVDSVFAGHVFQNLTAQSFDMVPDIRGKMSDSQRSMPSTDELLGARHLQSAGVAVILDIDFQNYHFITQPGALRRLLMNLLGNALKYTSHGYVRVSLDAKEMEDLPIPGITGSQESVARSMLTLRVTDSGRGISPEFLRSKLFTPFAQENSLSSGTGLGLSIVRKIVSLLEGEITIDSEVGRGTQVQVKLPILREMPKTSDSTSSTSVKSMMSISKDDGEPITLLRSRIAGQTASLHGFDLSSKDPVIRRLGTVLKTSVINFLNKWYGLQIVPFAQNPDFLICNEADPAMVESLVQKLPNAYKRKVMIIVLCSHNSRFDRTLNLSEVKYNLSYVAKPVGPLKLAKTILNSLGGALPTFTEGNDGILSPLKRNDLSNVFEELTISPRGGEVLDNTRMAADSANARKALESPTPNALPDKTAEFPFPDLVEQPDPSIVKALVNGLDKSAEDPVLATPVPMSPSRMKAIMPPDLKTNPPPRLKIKTPTLLVVDDNTINLRLLTTYLNRRNYRTVHEALNGLEAVEQFSNRPEGYDIIFMDITMPILDGFGATRQIRALEETRRKKIVAEIGTQGASMSTALIIAFTGRSSMEDQTEALRSGIDLFMTKPVSFKEVGKIIDNWLANKEREMKGARGSHGEK